MTRDARFCPRLRAAGTQAIGISCQFGRLSRLSAWIAFEKVAGRSCRYFADYIRWFFILAQSQKDRVADLASVRPFSEFYLSH